MKIVSYLLIVVFLSSCSSYLTSSENVSKTKTTYDKILVIGRSKDKTARIKFESQVVARFKENGVMAKASYEVDGTKTLRSTTSESQTAAIVKKLVSQGFDGVVLTNLINTEEYTDVIPGNTSTTYIPARYGRFGRHVGYYPISTWEPNQLKTGMKYIFESSFYNLTKKKGDNLEWVGRFELKDPSSIERTTDIYSKELVQALLKNNIQTNG
ncbi:hypothetical protein [Croceitalea rosinachiae]|uniref:DUF4136 domain-containing protein n=1 Tax=Croceitalea rosinachiae TaxID=3075596 RepID=A0ABU3AAN6_9FLAO|nr:hypothetical protein [Croceitalea sp. F388]MDT0605971.1 hypothetical protein [Croceitalea sp. F388]